MSLVQIDVSHKQLSKLRNGHPVRVKKGRGFNLIVHPERYDIITHTFSRGKALEIALSPEEIVANKEFAMSPESHQHMEEGENGEIMGRSIFHKIGKFVRGAVDAGRRVIKIGAPLIKDKLGGIAKEAIGKIAEQYGVHPDIAGLIKQGAELGVGHLVDSAGKGISNAGGPRSRFISNSLDGQLKSDAMMNELNKTLGTNYGYLGRAGIANVMAHTARAKDTGIMIGDRHNLNGLTGLPSGKGMGLGTGLYASNVRGRGIVGRGGSFVAHQTSLPPPLQSQPFGANFQFQHTLPPQYQKFSNGGSMVG